MGTLFDKFDRKHPEDTNLLDDDIDELRENDVEFGDPALVSRLQVGVEKRLRDITRRLNTRLVGIAFPCMLDLTATVLVIRHSSTSEDIELWLFALVIQTTEQILGLPNDR